MLNKLTTSLAQHTNKATMTIALILGLGLTTSATSLAAPAQARTAAAPAASATINLDELAKYAGIDRLLLDQAITQATYQQKIIDTMNKPYEGKPWYKYQKLFITDKRIQGGINFYLQHEQELLRAQNELGVAPEVICAIIGVETFFGQNMGTWKVLDRIGFEIGSKFN